MQDTGPITKAIVIKPGIIKNLTKYEAEGGWIDCDHIRFRSNRPEKIGGWVSEVVQQSDNPANTLFTGVPRAIFAWSALDSSKYLCVASNEKLEIMYGNKVYDVTPIRASSALNNAIDTVNGQSIVTIHDPANGTSPGDYIVVNSQAAPINGIDLLGQYQVVANVDADHYTIDSGTVASGTGNGGGALSIDYLLANGPQDNGNLTGWGGGTWGTPGQGGNGWGEPRSGVGGVELREWSLDNWGEDLLACERNGKIYHWTKASGLTTRAAVVDPSAPVQNLFMLVAQPSRQVVAFGSNVFGTGIFDPLNIRWSSSEDLADWNITLTNTAGEFRLPTGNYIVGAIQTRSEIIIFTNTDVYSMTYVGGEDIFAFNILGKNTSAISQHSFIDINGVVVWMGVDNFYIYNGVIEVLPTSLDKYIFSQFGDGQINTTQKEKAFAGINKQFNEVWWFYPQANGDNENGHYIKYNWLDQVWDFGSMQRNCWIDRGVFAKPYAIDQTGKLYVHETGRDADGQPLEAYITTAYFDIDDGTDLLFIDKILPDVKLPSNRNLEITIYLKKYPHPDSDITTKGPFFFSDTNRKVSVRGRGRQMALEYRVTATGADFEIGKMRIRYQPDGER